MSIKRINIGAEVLFSILFIIIGFSYSLRIFLEVENQQSLINLSFTLFVLAAIIGILGLVDSTAFKEKYFYGLVHYLSHLVKFLEYGGNIRASTSKKTRARNDEDSERA